MDVRGKRILVVDDEFTVVETLVDVLTWEGCDVRTAADGRQALKVMEQWVPDLILVDFMMPALDGVQMLELLRASESGARIPAVLMTAAPLRVAERAQLWDVMLRKPFELADLLRAMSEATRKRA